MSEWWNLDQALVWIVSRDPTRTDQSEGDPEGIQDRLFNYYCLDEAAGDPEDQKSEDGGEDTGEGALALLLRLLRDGQVEAVRADDETGKPVLTHVFNSYQIELHGPQPIFVLAKPRSRLDGAKGVLQTFLFVLLKRENLLTLFPPLAPSHLIPDLGADAAVAKKAGPLRKKRKIDLATEYLAREYPTGLPSDEHGKRTTAMNRLARIIHDHEGITISHETMLRAAGLRQ